MSVTEAAEAGTLLGSVTCPGSKRIIWILLLAAAQNILKMSWLLYTLGTAERVCPESQGFEDDDDDKLSYSCRSACPPLQSKSYKSLSDNQVDYLGEAIPFSLNSKHSHMVKDEDEKNRIYAGKLAEYARELEKEAQEFQTPLHKDVKRVGSLSEDEEHSWAYHFPVHQRSHILRTASIEPCGSYDSFQCSMGNHLGTDAFSLWAHASDPYLGYPEYIKGAEPHMLYEEAIRDGQFPSLQLTTDILRENAMLRRVVKSMQISRKSQRCLMQELQRQLEASLAKAERDAQELQSFVWQSEWNLQLMTQRALEAESNVEKLKQEIFILQGELESSKAENENLKASQTPYLGAMKGNIDFALQNLHKIIMGANWSIKQLTSGAELLHFVAEVLESTGKIQKVEAEEEP